MFLSSLNPTPPTSTPSLAPLARSIASLRLLHLHWPRRCICKRTFSVPPSPCIIERFLTTPPFCCVFQKKKSPVALGVLCQNFGYLDLYTNLALPFLPNLFNHCHYLSLSNCQRSKNAFGRQLLSRGMLRISMMRGAERTADWHWKAWLGQYGIAIWNWQEIIGHNAVSQGIHRYHFWENRCFGSSCLWGSISNWKTVLPL